MARVDNITFVSIGAGSTCLMPMAEWLDVCMRFTYYYGADLRRTALPSSVEGKFVVSLFRVTANRVRQFVVPGTCGLMPQNFMIFEPDRAQMQRWAARQLADLDALQPGSIFASGVMLDVTQAYELQSAVAELRRSRGEQIIGYKVGCTSPKVRAQLGIDHCVTGRLYDLEQYASGAVLSRSKYANLAIEGELGVELSRAPTAEDFVKTGVPACVARIFPVVELHHHVLRGKRASVGELIAHNAIHAGFVAGSGVRSDEAFGEPSLSIQADGRVLEECAGPELIHTIHSSLHWLTKTLAERGEQLTGGQSVLTGSIPLLIPLREDCRIRVEAPPFGSVEVQFTA